MANSKTPQEVGPGRLSSTLNALLPALKPCREIRIGHGDVLIHAPGFEDRTLAITQLIKVDRKSNAILLQYQPDDPKNRLSDVKSALLARGVVVSVQDIIEYHRFEPDDFESRLKARLRALDASQVTIDISTMSKLEIMLVLHA